MANPLRRLFRRSGRLSFRLILSAFLLLAAPAVHAQLDQAPGPDSPRDKQQVRIYRAEPDEIAGTVTIPDTKARVLIQPEGREWREFRNVYLRIGAGVVMLGMVALLAVFYLKRGTIAIEAGRSGHTIVRFGGVERFAHWLTAVSFILLALTGLLEWFGRLLLMPLIGQETFAGLAWGGKQIHNFLSLPFVLGLLMMLGLWVRDNIPRREDIAWLKEGGGLFRPGLGPESGRFNAGQKLMFWMVVLGGGALAVTGYLLMAPFAVTGVGGMQIFQMIHATVAALMIALIIGHIYIGTLGMEGAFDAMGSGRVDENWAREHHRRWYDQQTGRQSGGMAEDEGSALRRQAGDD